MASIFKSGGGTELISIYFNIHGNEQLKKSLIKFLVIKTRRMETKLKNFCLLSQRSSRTLRRERDSNPRNPLTGLYAFQAHLFSHSSTPPNRILISLLV